MEREFRTYEEALMLVGYIKHMINSEPDVDDLRIFYEHQSEGEQKIIFLKVIIPYQD